nr:hypothetical protein Iba_chr09aCG6410 [Ipomoea batatas]
MLLASPPRELESNVVCFKHSHRAAFIHAQPLGSCFQNTWRSMNSSSLLHSLFPSRFHLW